MAAFLSFLPQLLATLGATAAPTAPAATGASAAPAAAPQTNQPVGLAGLMNQVSNAWKTYGKPVLNQAGPINNLLSAMNQGRELMQPQQPQFTSRTPAQPASSPPPGLFANMPFQPHQVPSPVHNSAQGIAGLLGLNPALLAQLLEGHGM